MAYVPTVWATGDIITAEKLNKAEQGIAAANSVGGIVVAEDAEGTLNLKWSEMKAIQDAGNMLVVYITPAEGIPIPIPQFFGSLMENSGTYYAATDAGNVYTTDSEDGYPEHLNN